MRKLWVRSLALSLGLLATGGRGQDAAAQAPLVVSSGSAPPPVALGRPVVIAASKPAAATAPTATPTAAAVSIGRPVAIATAARVDPQLQPVSFSAPRDPLAPVVRGAAPDGVSGRPMPVGPNADPGAAGMYSWRRGDEVVASTTAAPGVVGGPALGGMPAAAPMPGGPTPGAQIISGPLAGTPLAGAPVVGGPVIAGPAGPFPAPTVVSGAGVLASGGNCGCNTCGGGLLGGHAGHCGGGHCGGGWGGGCDGGCCPDAGRWVIGAEYLMWWLKGDNTPPLLVASPTGLPLNTPEGSATSSVLYGGQSQGRDGMSGLRLNGQYWFSDNHCWGLDLGAFYLASHDIFTASSPGVPSIGRPTRDFVEQIANLPTVDAFGTSGSFTAERSSTLWGFDVNLRKNLWCGDVCYFDLLCGYRTVGLEEKLAITENVLITSDPIGTFVGATGTRNIVNDQFTTSNRFFGPQVGFDSMLRKGNWTLGVRSKLAVGVTEQVVTIGGSTVTNGVSSPGGLLALSTNSGRQTHRAFGVIPEVGLTVGYDVKEWWRIFAGYNFLYWNSVVRPGDQINTNVNASYLPNSPVPPNGAAEPAPLFRRSELWAHGVSLGMEFRW
ncbi:MAG: BBP7 family outer membrane beta-barrel protein [Gemmataceae bacterium]